MGQAAVSAVGCRNRAVQRLASLFVVLLLGVGPHAHAQNTGNPEGTNLPDQTAAVKAVAEKYKGSHDLAGAAEALVAAAGDQFVYSYGDASDPKRMPFDAARSFAQFFGQRLMICYEFVHYVAFLASNQRDRDGSPLFGAAAGSAYDTRATETVWDGKSEIPRGKIIVFQAYGFNNLSGYYHIGISLGGGKIAHNSSSGNVQISDLSDVTSVLYSQVLIADYNFANNGEGAATPPTPPVMPALTEGSTPQSVKETPPVAPAPPPVEGATSDGGCPECAGIARDIDLTRRGIADVDKHIGRLDATLAQNRADQAALAGEIAGLQAQLDAQANKGVGGSAFDPATGFTTTAMAQKGGTVLITVTDANGNQIAQRVRPQRSLAAIQAELAAKQAALKALKAPEAGLLAQLARAQSRRDGLVADFNRLELALADCLAKCRKRAGMPPSPDPGNPPPPPAIDNPDLSEPPAPCPAAAQSCAGPRATFAAAALAYSAARATLDQAVQHAADTARALEAAATALADIVSSLPAGSPEYITALDKLETAKQADLDAFVAQTKALDALTAARARVVAARTALVDCYLKAKRLCGTGAAQPGPGTTPPTDGGAGGSSGPGVVPPAPGSAGSGGTAPVTDGPVPAPFTCPECAAWAKSVGEYQFELRQLDRQEAKTRAELEAVKAAEKAAQGRIDALDQLLNAQAGAGGSGFDPGTGLSTESITRADGTVVVTVRDASGAVVAGPALRSRADVNAATADAASARQRLAASQAVEAQLNKDLDWLKGRRTTVNRMLDTARKGLADCEQKCREKRMALFNSIPLCLASSFCANVGSLAGIVGGGLAGAGVGAALPGYQLYVAGAAVGAASVADAAGAPALSDARSWRFAPLEAGAAQAAFEPGDRIYVVAVAAASGGEQPSIAFVANGRSTGEAFELQVRDPSGRIKAVAVPDGLVLEPVAVPPRGHRAALESPSDISLPYTGFCIEFHKEPPPPGTAYRVAGLAQQQRFRALRHILTAGRELAAHAQLHPDSVPVAYAEGIRQYALWTSLEHWDERQFAQALLARTQKNAAQLHVQWTTEMQRALEAAVPNRWRDISAVLSSAAALERTATELQPLSR